MREYQSKIHFVDSERQEEVHTGTLAGNLGDVGKGQMGNGRVQFGNKEQVETLRDTGRKFKTQAKRRTPKRQTLRRD